MSLSISRITCMEMFFFQYPAFILLCLTLYWTRGPCAVRDQPVQMLSSASQQQESSSVRNVALQEGRLSEGDQFGLSVISCFHKNITWREKPGVFTCFQHSAVSCHVLKITVTHSSLFDCSLLHAFNSTFVTVACHSSS